MQTVTTIGFDIAKAVFQVHGSTSVPPSIIAYARRSCSNHTGIVGQQYAASDSRTQPNIKSPGCLTYGRSDLRPI